MKKLGNFLTFIGVFLLVVVPTYQLIDEYATNTGGDGERIYGDNILKNVLGVKILNYSQPIPGEGWVYQGTEIHTPIWMQKFGTPKIVNWGNEEHAWNSSTLQIIDTIVLRLIAKLSPLLLLVFGRFLLKRYP